MNHMNHMNLNDTSAELLWQIHAAPTKLLTLPLNMHIAQLVTMDQRHMLDQVVILLRHTYLLKPDAFKLAYSQGMNNLNTTMCKWEQMTEHRVNNAVIRCLYLCISYYRSHGYTPEKAEIYYMEQLSYLAHLLLSWRSSIHVVG